MSEQTVTPRPGYHALAIVSLALSILGLAGILPLAGAIGGIITGMIARREIRERPEAYTGDGVAQAGIILGWIGLALGLLLCMIFLLFLIPGFGLFSIRSFDTGPMPMPLPTIELIVP
jgi:hypothetical protein